MPKVNGPPCNVPRDLGFDKLGFYTVFSRVWKISESYRTMAGPDRLGADPVWSDTVRIFGGLG